MTRRWERVHHSGWLASRVADPDPVVGFTYSARQPGVPLALWVSWYIDVALAKECADAIVPEHGCTSPGWIEREGT
jgi:hypothetical protein